MKIVSILFVVLAGCGGGSGAPPAKCTTTDSPDGSPLFTSCVSMVSACFGVSCGPMGGCDLQLTYDYGIHEMQEQCDCLDGSIACGVSQ